MKGIRKITVNLPTDLLEQAMKHTQKGITFTLIEGLKELDRNAKRLALINLGGKVKFDLDLVKTRR